MSLHDWKLVDAAAIGRQLSEAERNLTRRGILGGLGLIASAAAGLRVGSSVGTIKNLHHAIKGDLTESDADHCARVKALFGVQNDTRFVPGVVHYKFKGLMHPADIKTLEPIAKAYFADSNSIEILGEEHQLIMGAHVDTSLFCAGGPVSNQVSRLALQYRLIDPNMPELGVMRISEPVFRLAYEYICSADTLAWSDTQVIRDLPHGVPDWSIRDTSSGNPLFRPPGVVDYLVITVLPQVLDTKGYEHGHKIVIVGGGHGIGTLATVLLLRSGDVVRKMQELTKTLAYWQALIPVTGVATQGDSTVPISIDVQGAIVAPVTFDGKVLEESFLFGLARSLSKGVSAKTEAFIPQQNTLDFKPGGSGKMAQVSSPSEIDSNRSIASSRSGEGGRTAAPHLEQQMSDDDPTAGVAGLRAFLRRLESEREPAFSPEALARVKEIARDKKKSIDYLQKLGILDEHGELRTKFGGV
jgi:hypothetical protein